MPAAARKGDQVITGHSCDGTTEIEFGEESVIIGGKQAAYEGYSRKEALKMLPDALTLPWSAVRHGH